MTRLRMLPTKTFGDSENRESIVLVPEDLQAEFPPKFEEKYPGEPQWPDLLISPSQVSTYTACNRKWGWNKLEGKKEPEKPSQATGKRYHKALEDWLSRGDAPRKEEDRVFKALPHFPEPATPGLSVERYFAMLVDDVVFHGYTDVDVLDAANPVTGASPILEVYDLKTTKDFCWAKTPEMLLADPQASVYALKQMIEGEFSECATRWVYCLTEGKRAAVPVDVLWTFNQALEVVLGWAPFARAMIAAHREKKKALDLGFNAGHCGAYGGCFYQGMCQISAKDRMISMFRQDKLETNRRETVGMSLKEKMAQDLAKRGQALPPTGGVVSVQKTAASKAAEPKEETTATSAKKPSLADVAKSMAESKPVKLATGINPPDATPDPRMKVDEVVVETAEAAPEPVAEAPKKPRKTKATEEAPTAAPKVDTQGFGFFLLVDALVEKGATLKRVDDLIRPVREELEQKTQCVSYRLLDFGKGPAMLAAGLREALSTNRPSGVFTVDSRAVDPAVLEVLTEFADNIVRGVR